MQTYLINREYVLDLLADRTQTWLADKADMKFSVLSRVMNGNRATRVTCNRIAKALGVYWRDIIVEE